MLQNDIVVVHSPETLPSQRACTLYPVICDPSLFPKPSFAGHMKSTAASVEESIFTLINSGAPGRPPKRRDAEDAEGGFVHSADVPIHCTTYH